MGGKAKISHELVVVLDKVTISDVDCLRGKLTRLERQLDVRQTILEKRSLQLEKELKCKLEEERRKTVVGKNKLNWEQIEISICSGFILCLLFFVFGYWLYTVSSEASTLLLREVIEDN